MRKRVMVSVVMIAIIIFGLAVLSFNPIILNKTDAPQTYIEVIESQAKGLYSHRLPLVPAFVTVDSLSENMVYYTIYYFPFGTLGMSFTEGDGYNIEKPLTGL